MKLSLIVPCYNEEGNLFPLYEKVTETFRGKLSDYEFIFVNDGSFDRTASVLRELASVAKEPVRVISFSRNFGKEAAIFAGLQEASGDYISLIDADLQQNPEFVLIMSDYLDAHPETDCVCAVQEVRKENAALTFLKHRFYSIINRISDTEFVNGASDFRTFRKPVAEAVLNMPEYHRFSKGLFSWVGFNTYYMPYTVEERLSGTSKWNLKKLFKYAFEGIAAFTVKPLKLPLYLGVLSVGLSPLYALLKSRKKSSSETDKLISVLLLISGVQLTSIGILGEYLSKMYAESKQRPVYIAKERYSNRDE